MKKEISWLVSLSMVGAAVFNVLQGDFGTAAFALLAGTVGLIPAVTRRDWRDVAPPETVMVAASPFLVEVFVPGMPGRFFSYFAGAGIALVLVSELAGFTDLKLNDRFALFLVGTFTVAAAGYWALTRWAVDMLLGTSTLPGHDPLMWEFTLALVSGAGAGIFYDLYFRRWRNAA